MRCFGYREEISVSHAYTGAQYLNVPRHVCIHHLLEDQAERTPDALAIIAPGRPPLTYGRLHRHMADVVQTLHAMGLGRHDRIALVLPNGPELAVAFLAVAAGATCAPLNPAYSADEFAAYLVELHVTALIVLAGMDSPARAVAPAYGIRIIELLPMRGAEAGRFILTGGQSAHPAPHEFARPDDVALVLPTSGTTSRPKIVPLTHTNVCTAAHNMRLALALVESDRCLSVLPFFHAHALLTALLASLVAGASVVCTAGFSAPQFFAWVAGFRPTWYTAVPAMHQAILAHAALYRELIARAPLRFIRSASAALPPRVCVGLERVFNAPVLESYGMTETAAQITSNPLPPQARKAGSVGLAAGPEVAVMDEAGVLLPTGEIGEIVVRGATVMRGYDNNPTANRDAFTHGWFRTGDLGYMDTDGYLFITGRLKEIINCGGEKIAPQEVDNVLLDHPAVAQAVTFAIPHPQLGEDIAAAVVLRPGTVATDSDLRVFAMQRLAAFKVPRHVRIVADIPKSPLGKPQRIGLAEKLGLTTPGWVQPERQADFAAPRTSLERLLVGLWTQVLGLERVGIHDNFFQLGGDSLLATQLMSRVHDALHVEMSFRNFFSMPTVAGIAQYIERANEATLGL
jgi:acyl-CoA synthetase (AMP-forming)/AMP-acid ligase II/acyl carrier protein